MKLYYHPASPNCRKAMAVINHLNLDVELEVVDIMKGVQREPEFLAKNPNGKVPLLQDGEFNLWESNAIISYLAGTAEANTLWPADKRRYDIMRWMFWEKAHWGQPAGTLIGEQIFKPMRGGEPDATVIEQAEKDFHKNAEVLNTSLEGRDYLVGDSWTLADFAVAAILTYAGPAKFPLDSYPHINAWWERFNQLDSWKKTAPPPM